MKNMDRSKLLVVGGIAVVLIVVFMLVRMLTGGETVQPQFRDAMVLQFTVMELSDIATKEANSPELRNRASIISSTTASDFQNLKEYYTQSFGSLPGSNSEQDSIDKLDDTSEGFDELYRELTLGYLRNSRDLLLQLRGQGSAEFEETVNTAIHNHQTHIDFLTR